MYLAWCARLTVSRQTRRAARVSGVVRRKKAALVFPAFMGLPTEHAPSPPHFSYIKLYCVKKQCCESGMIFLRIRILLFSWFLIWLRIQILCWILQNFFLIFLTLILPLYVFFCNKKEFIFYNWAFVLRNCPILSVFQSSLLKIHFRSGATRIRNDYFRIRILLKVSDPTGSGSTTL